MRQRTTFSSSNYRGGRLGLSNSRGGTISRGGRYISRDTLYRDIRRGLGLSGG